MILSLKCKINLKFWNNCKEFEVIDHTNVKKFGLALLLLLALDEKNNNKRT